MWSKVDSDLWLRLGPASVTHCPWPLYWPCPPLPGVIHEHFLSPITSHILSHFIHIASCHCTHLWLYMDRVFQIHLFHVCVSVYVFCCLICLCRIQVTWSSPGMASVNTKRCLGDWRGRQWSWNSSVLKLGVHPTSHCSHRLRGEEGARLTHWGQDKMATILQTTFWNVFSSMKGSNLH